jgi:hypothetical protein
MRLALLGLLAAGGLALSVALGWGGTTLVPATASGQSSWRLRELALLKAALERVQHDFAHPNDGMASLEAERNRILRQIRATAELMPPDAVPAEFRKFLPPGAGAGPAAREASLARLIETVAAEAPAPRSPDLRVGLSLVRRPVAPVASFAMDPALREPIRAEPRSKHPERRKKHTEAAREPH